MDYAREHAATAPAPGSVSLPQNTRRSCNLNTDPTTLQLYAAGSANQATSVDFDEQLRAPDTIDGRSTRQSTSPRENNNHVDLVGAVAAKKFQIGNNSSVTYDGRVTGIMTTDWAIVYQNGAWQECTTVPSGLALDSGC